MGFGYGGGGTTDPDALSWPVADNVFSVGDNGDPTKLLVVSTGGKTTGTTSTLSFSGGAQTVTVPATSFTVAGIGLQNTWSADQLATTAVRWFFGAGAGTNYNAITFNAAQTPDAAILGTGALANYWLLAEVADAAFDFAHPQLTQPGLVIQSEDQSTTQYTRHQAGSITTQRRRTLTEAGGAEELFRITTAAGDSGGGEIDYKIHVTDGTDYATRAGKIRFVFNNRAGTVTATLSGADETADGSVADVSAGETLTYALTANVATANVFIFLINIDSNITVNAAHADYIVTYNGPGEVVFP